MVFPSPSPSPVDFDAMLNSVTQKMLIENRTMILANRHSIAVNHAIIVATLCWVVLATIAVLVFIHRSIKGVRHD